MPKRGRPKGEKKVPWNLRVKPETKRIVKSKVDKTQKHLSTPSRVIDHTFSEEK